MTVKKVSRWFALFAALFSFHSAVFADELESLFQAGKYSEALEILKSQPEPTARFHYNIGTVYYHLGKLGLAVAHLEKANHIQPHDLQTQRNLKLARQNLSTALGGKVELDPSSSWIEQLADRVNLDEMRGVLGLLGCLLLIVWIKRYRKTRRLRSTLVQPSAICTLLFLFVSLVLYVAERSSQATPPAIAMDGVSLRSGPGNEFLELTKIPAGIKLRVLQKGQSSTGNEPWVQVRYSSEGVGWAPESSLLLF